MRRLFCLPRHVFGTLLPGGYTGIHSIRQSPVLLARRRRARPCVRKGCVISTVYLYTCIPSQSSTASTSHFFLLRVYTWAHTVYTSRPPPKKTHKRPVP